MNTRSPGKPVGTRQPRSLCASVAVLACLALPAILATGCDDRTSERFRTASMSLFADGLKSLANGLITGITTLNTPETTTTGGTSGTAGTSGSSGSPSTGTTL